MNVNTDARSRSDDGWRLFEELAVTCAGPVLVELPEPADVPELGKLVTTPPEAADD